MYSDPDSDSASDPDETQQVPCVSSEFTKVELARVRSVVAEAAIPSWMERPPANLGEASHGKLKADLIRELFTIFLPLTLCDIWGSTASNRNAELLQNFAHVVKFTTLFYSYRASNNMANAFHDNYLSYLQSKARLFPSVPSVPNHHVALHLRDVMKYFGPLVMASEYVYEAAIGAFQSVNTNSRFG